MPSNVVVIKVKRTSVGKQLAFDKLYLFKREDEDLIPNIFGYALVFPATNALLREITSLEPQRVSHFKQHRDDATLNNKLTPPTNVLSLEDWWQTNYVDKYGLNDRLVVIPVLTSNLKDKIHPKYLASQSWYTRRGSGRKRRRLPIAHNPKGPAISDVAYLATPLDAPDNRITPICMICPRQLLQLQGDCEPGQAICLQSLDFKAIGHTQSLTDDVDAEPDYSDEENPFAPSDFTSTEEAHS